MCLHNNYLSCLHLLYQMVRGGKRRGAGRKKQYATIQERRHAQYLRRRDARLVRQTGQIVIDTIPSTLGHQRVLQLHLILQAPCIIKDPLGQTLARSFSQLVSPSLLSTLTVSTATLVAQRPPTAGTRGSRGDVQRYHFGCWRDYARNPYIIQDSEEPPCKEWMAANAPLFTLLSTAFQQLFPDLYARYQAVALQLPMQCFSPWAAVALNINFPALPHQDSHDYRHGLCWVVPFGEWEGGNLRLHNLNKELVLGAGDVVCFRSTTITHSVAPYKGHRHSLVFFSHDSLFFPPAP